jgi:hypothetical protein
MSATCWLVWPRAISRSTCCSRGLSSSPESSVPDHDRRHIPQGVILGRSRSTNRFPELEDSGSHAEWQPGCAMRSWSTAWLNICVCWIIGLCGCHSLAHTGHKPDTNLRLMIHSDSFNANSDCCQTVHPMMLDSRSSGSPPDSCRAFYRKFWT